jgi:HPt (histidine-containing phosphotransfer) domain-containing protein
MSEVLNYHRALERLEGDVEFYRELLGVFREDVRKNLELVEKSRQEESFADMHRLAHSIRSSALSVGAELVSECAAQLERCVHTRPDQIQVAIIQLTASVELLEKAAQELQLKPL